MKKKLIILLATVMVLCCVACGNKSNDKTTTSGDDKQNNSIDMSKYPSEITAWSGQNFIDYFKATGIFTDGDGFETWLQDHANYWPGTPVSECAGWWNDEGTVMVMITILDGSLADSSKEMYDEWVNSIKKDKTLPGDYSTLSVDHLVGNVAFTYETTTLDEAVYKKVDAAYKSLIAALKVTPEF